MDPEGPKIGLRRIQVLATRLVDPMTDRLKPLRRRSVPGKSGDHKTVVRAVAGAPPA